MALSEQLENEYRAAVERIVREARASGVTGGVPVPSKWQWMSAEVERLRGEYAQLRGMVEEAVKITGEISQRWGKYPKWMRDTVIDKPSPDWTLGGERVSYVPATLLRDAAAIHAKLTAAPTGTATIRCACGGDLVVDEAGLNCSRKCSTGTAEAPPNNGRLVAIPDGEPLVGGENGQCFNCANPPHYGPCKRTRTAEAKPEAICVGDWVECPSGAFSGAQKVRHVFTHPGPDVLVEGAGFFHPRDLRKITQPEGTTPDVR